VIVIGNVTVHHGNCLDILPTLPDCSVDSVVTDPPYELSQDGKASASRVALEIMFPKENAFDCSGPQDDGFAFLLSEIAKLRLVGIAPRETTTVPVGAVAFNGQVSGGQVEVNDADVPPAVVTQGQGCDNGQTEGAEHLGCFALKLADREAAIDALNRTGAGFVSGGIGVGFAVATASLPSLLSSSGAVIGGDELVGAINDALPVGVGAGGRAVDLSVPHPFTLRRGAHNDCTTASAVTFLTIALLCGAQLIRATARTTSAATVAQPTRFCVVDHATGRTLTFDLVLGHVDYSTTGFMGKEWDGTKIAYRVDLWSEVLRVLKPGGHLLAFGGTRTYHRMAVAIEDAGFEIRDSIHWIYGSGFPKSLDVSKAIDKQRDDRKDIYKVTAWVRAARDAAGISNRDIDDAFGFAGMAGHWTSAKSQPAVPTLEQVPTLLEVLGVGADNVPEDIRRLLWDLNGKKGQPGENWAKREVVGKSENGIAGGTGKHTGEDNAYGFAGEFDITAPATDAAKQWEGWGTALKPAHEPMVVARRPLIGTVAANVLQHGTGALNIDGARIEGYWKPVGPSAKGGKSGGIMGKPVPGKGGEAHASGRWPANVIFDPDAATELDRQQDGASRFFYIAKPSKAERNAGLDGLPKRNKYQAGGVGGTGGKRDVAEAVNATPAANHHPTVKPLTLMRYLVRLVTPPGGTVLEPFAGSGTTLMAATMEGFNSIGIEMTDDYLPIIEGRVRWAQTQQQELPL
jgi:DNA modification methylase